VAVRDESVGLADRAGEALQERAGPEEDGRGG